MNEEQGFGAEDGLLIVGALFIVGIMVKRAREREAEAAPAPTGIQYATYTPPTTPAAARPTTTVAPAATQYVTYALPTTPTGAYTPLIDIRSLGQPLPAPALITPPVITPTTTIPPSPELPSIAPFGVNLPSITPTGPFGVPILGTVAPRMEFAAGSTERQALAPYDALIEAAAARHGVPANLVRAVILAESSGQANAKTYAPTVGLYAYGLMQVLPTTAQWLGYTGPEEGLLDPATNIQYGTAYLAYQYRRYGGDVEATAAAYNAGTAYYAADGSFTNQFYVDRVMSNLALV